MTHFSRMTRRCTLSPWRVSAFAIASLLPVATRSPAYQQPVPPPGQGSASDLKLTATEEKDSYEIYSMLLRTEMHGSNITFWVIEQETRTFPDFGPDFGDSVNNGVCVQPPKEQESVYRPLIDDYVAKNKAKPVLERKFDLPLYALVGPADLKAIYQRSRVAAGVPLKDPVIFHVSAVGFNPDGNRALVYVGHHCGNLCGGGTYHLLFKKDGRWQVDQEYRGAPFCGWVS